SDEEESDYKAKAQDDFEDEIESDKQESDEPKQKKKTSRSKKAKTKKHEDESEDSEDSPASKNPKGQDKKGDRRENEQGEAYFQLSDKKRVTVREFKNMILIDFREYFRKDGEYLPGKKGMSLQVDQWNKLKEQIDDIDAEIKKLE
ncbi:520_t:CDS:2, partial [Dentiscutata erythropus]